jgi:hypothetical protein
VVVDKHLLSTLSASESWCAKRVGHRLLDEELDCRCGAVWGSARAGRAKPRRKRLRRSHSHFAHQGLQAFLARLHVARGGPYVLVARRFPYLVNFTALISKETYELMSEIMPRQSAFAADWQARMTE